MQQPNASPHRPALGLPIPASPADSGFLPRREFLPSSSKAKASNFALLSFSNTSSLRLSAFPPSVVGAVRKFFDEKKLLKIYKDNRPPLKDKENIENDRPADRPEDEFVAELTLVAKFWANAKTVETERLIIQILVLFNSQGYALLTSIAGREPGDKLTLVFERPVVYHSSPQQAQPNVNGHTPGHRQSGHGGSTGSAIANNGVHQLLFGISFTSPTSFRCINPPLESTPGILQALRNAWPRGVEGESKIADGCFEFKLRGYSFFADDTYQTDFLALTVALLKGLQKLHFTFISSISLSNSHAKNKELWLFASNDTDALSPHQLLNSISTSPVAFTTGTLSGAVNDGTFPRTYSSDKEKTAGHLRAASVDTAQAQQTPQGSAFSPGHQRNATTPAFGTNAFGSTSTLGTITGGKGPTTPRSQGSVLVKKSHSMKKQPDAALSESKGATPPGTAGANVTPPKEPTPPAASTGVSKQVGILPASSSKPITAPSSSKPQIQQQVLYSTPTSGNVLYSTPPSSPPVSYNHFPAPASHSAMHPSSPHSNLSPIEASPPSSPRSSVPRPASPSKTGAGRPSNIDIPPNTSTTRAVDEEGPTPPLLSSSAFRDTLSDRGGEQTAGRDSLFSGGTSIMSGKSGESFDVPVMWTGGLGGVGLGTTLEEREEDEDANTFRGTAALPTPNPPGGWVEDPSSPPVTTQRPRVTGKASRETTRSTKEKERTVEAKVDGAHIVTVSTPNQEAPQAAVIGTTGDLASDAAASASDSKDKDKSDGWVMVKVSGDQQGIKKSTKPAAGPLRAVNASPGSMSSMETPPAAVPIKSDTSNNANRASKSGDESSSSHDRSAPPSSLAHSNTAPRTGTKSLSGFRKLFGRGDKDKDKVGSRLNLESPTKRSRWAKVKADIVPTPAEPARASRRMTIE